MVRLHWVQFAVVQVLRDGNDAKFAAVQELFDVFLEPKKIHDDIS